VHIGLGFAMLVLPLVGFYLIFKHWHKVKWPFAANLLGIVSYVFAAYLQSMG